MRFLVIGASGFLGSHIWEYLTQTSDDVIGTQCMAKGNSFVTFDLLKQRIGSCIDPSFFRGGGEAYVVICAAFSQMDRCLTEKSLSHKINVERTQLLIDDVLALGGIPVFISTNAVYDGERGRYNEASKREPINEYGRQKLETERYLEANAPEALIFRLDKMMSDDISKKHMFVEWYQALEQGRPIICIDQLFSPTYARDIARAIERACELGLSGAYNVCNSEVFTREALAREFAAAVGKKAEIIVRSQADLHFVEKRLVNATMDPARFIRETGMRFTGMRELYGSFLRKKLGYKDPVPL